MEIKCKRCKSKGDYCWQHISKSTTVAPNASNKMVVDTSIFCNKNATIADWELAYTTIMCPKYKKNTRNFKEQPITTNTTTTPTIYIIPRERGSSYKKVPLVGIADNSIVYYCPISKGYSMQDVSSFTLGPIVGEGLCMVNAAFSKSICVFHLVGGCVDLKRKIFWKPATTKVRNIKVMSINAIEVDGRVYNTHAWLKDNEDKWLPEWEKWRQSIAMASIGNFHWTGDETPVAYRYGTNYLTFVEWKKQCYVAPSYALLPTTKVYAYLEKLYKSGATIGLVHPKGRVGEEKPITKQYVIDMYNSPYEMCCQPYVIAGKLLGVTI